MAWACDDPGPSVNRTRTARYTHKRVCYTIMWKNMCESPPIYIAEKAKQSVEDFLEVYPYVVCDPISSRFNEITDWLKDNCVGPYKFQPTEDCDGNTIFYQGVFFSNKEDAVGFKLTWVGK